MAAANRELIRAINRFKILHTIRNHGRISRVEIAKATGLSQASVTGITADLIEAGAETIYPVHGKSFSVEIICRALF